MKQVNLNWIKANAYNVGLLDRLIDQVHQATEDTGIVYRGWVSDEPEENGIISIVGMTRNDEAPADTAFLYTEAELREHEKLIREELTGQITRIAPPVGTTIMATIKTEFNARGDVGVVEQVGSQTYGIIRLAVKWKGTTNISYLCADEYTVVQMAV